MALGCHPAPTVPGGNGGGTTGEKGELRSGKVMLADPIRVSHLFIPLRAREDLTQVEPSLHYRMNATFWKGKRQIFFCFSVISSGALHILCTHQCK